MRTFVAFVLLISIVQQAVPARTLARSAAYDITSGRCVTTGMARTLHNSHNCIVMVSKPFVCACRRPDKLNVHLVSHTHNDPGWLRSYTGYFYAANPDSQVR
jgi:hypothetical protein